MTFIDLFAGLGGFHKALKELGHQCVFVSEIDSNLRELYKKNWGNDVNIHGDIRKIVSEDISQIPNHDILCAGFPCQPFSKAGKQLGLKDERGTLFDEITKILKYRKPKYFILENVKFLANHNNEQTLSLMLEKLKNLNYDVYHVNYSPHEFGIPHNRYRIFILGCYGKNSLKDLNLNSIQEEKKNSNIAEFLDNTYSDSNLLPKEHIECLDLWQEFVDSIPNEVKLPGFPIWSMEFGATYPFESDYPYKLTEKELGNYKGSFGVSLITNREEQLKLLPSYARTKTEFPEWKKKYIKNNRAFFKENKNYIKDFVKKISQYESQSWQKLEWNIDKHERNLFNNIIQFRASGIRISRKNKFPCLVSTSNIPIIGWEKRYISKNEALKLQSLEGLSLFDNENESFKALGNAVNSKIVKLIAEKLFTLSNYKINVYVE